jgi:prolyl oligopeptidase
MKTKTMLICLTTFLMALNTTGKAQKKPPLMQAKPVEDEYFGKKISDPFRYMEDLQDPEVMQWIKAQSEYSRSVLNSIPGRQSLIDKMWELDKRKSSTISQLKITDNDRYFYLKTMPDEETGKLFYRDGYQGTESLLYNPQTFDTDTTRNYSLTNISPSDDGAKVFFLLYPADGSGNNVFITIDVESKKIVEQIERPWMSIASWLPDGRGYLINLPNETHIKEKKASYNDSRICLHYIGSDPTTDKEIFSRTKYPELGIKPEDMPNATYDKNSQNIFCFLLSSDRRNNVFYAPTAEINKEKIDWKHLFKREDEVYNFIATEKELFLRTPKEAPNFKILKTSLKNSDLANAEVVIPENPLASLTSFRITNEGIYFILSRNGIQNNLYHLFYGEKIAVEIELPKAAITLSLSTKGFKSSDLWIDLSGWVGDYQRYRYLGKNNGFILESLSTIPEYPEYTDLMVEKLMITSHDGVKVPLSLVYKKGIEKNGENSVLFFGYGAYGQLTYPVVDPNLLLWVHEGGIFAVAHVRGGGELGEQWHKAGVKTTKPNTWKDLIACAEYLIAENYTRSQKIAITSLSAGGILIGMAMTERPDLFAAAIPQVGLLNPLRLEKLPVYPFHVNEFGNVNDFTECMALIEMDPYLHLEAGIKYPATLITAGMIDPMIISWVPAKFAARLQSANASDKPILFWANPEAGHLGNSKKQQFEALADVLSFALWQTGHPKYLKE